MRATAPTDEADSLRELAEKARRVVRLMCERGRWQMCVPPQDDDSDMVVCKLADVAESASAVLSVLREKVAERRLMGDGEYTAWRSGADERYRWRSSTLAQCAHELETALRRGDEPSSLPMSGQPGDASRNASDSNAAERAEGGAPPPLPATQVPLGDAFAAFTADAADDRVLRRLAQLIGSKELLYREPDGETRTTTKTEEAP